MADLYVLGGQQRALRPLSGGLDWYEYEKGLILEIGEDRKPRVRVEYISPVEARVEPDPVVLFKSGTIAGDRLYACTQTEVLIYALPGFELVTYVSIPLFNDLHHVRPSTDGNLLVAVSGLDLVVEVSLGGQVIHEWSVLDEDPWARFSRDVDYRKVRTTKPHHAHPNQVFYINDEPWATRFEQRDAVSLVDRRRRIPIDLERVHDGLVHGDCVYFTTVDGHVVIADTNTLKVVDVLDLNKMVDPDTLLGWARGIHMGEDGLWVGFSRIRPTRFRENVAWVARGFKQSRPTHVARFDLARGRCVETIDLEPAGLGAVFSVLPAFPDLPEIPAPGVELAGAGN
jgi:hypothetical protein